MMALKLNFKRPIGGVAHAMSVTKRRLNHLIPQWRFQALRCGKNPGREIFDG
jgi:hypothetical protein